MSHFRISLLASWRRVSRLPSRLLGIKHFDCTVEPAKDLYEMSEGFACIDTDPQLILRPLTGNLQAGWYLLSYQADTQVPDQIFVPKIYPLASAFHELNVRNVNDFSRKEIQSHDKNRKIWFRNHEKGATTLQAHTSGRAIHLFYYKFEETGFRLDPFDLDFPRSDVSFTGWFSMKRVRLTRLGRVPLLGYSIFHTLQMERASAWRRLRIAARFLSSRGHPSCLSWLTHCAYWHIQPPLTSPRSWYARFNTGGATPSSISALMREQGK